MSKMMSEFRQKIPANRSDFRGISIGRRNCVVGFDSVVRLKSVFIRLPTHLRGV